MQDLNWSNKRTNKNNHLTLLSKGQCNKGWNNFYLFFFFFHGHDEKKNPFGLSKYTQKDIFCKNLTNWSRTWWLWMTWLNLMNLSMKVLEKTLLGNIQIMAQMAPDLNWIKLHLIYSLPCFALSLILSMPY